MENNSQFVQQKFKQINLIWMVLLGTTLMYGGLILVLKPTGQPQNPVVLMAIAPLALLTLGMVIFLRKSMTRRLQDDQTTAAQYSRAVIVSSALAESVSIFGIVFHLLGSPIHISFSFLAASVICLLIVRPRYHEFVGLMESHSRSSDGL